MRRPDVAVLATMLALAVSVVVACGSESDPAEPGADGGEMLAEGGASSGLIPLADSGYRAGDGAPGTCIPYVAADGTSPQCADCKDNDGDGLVDWLDPECAGPLDNDEKTFGTGIAGDNVDACKQDCFFDGNSGQGDDKCEWNLKCDPAITTGACVYDPTFKNCPPMQSDACIKNCQKLVPNGCDCFGCCAVQTTTGASKTVRLDSTCSLADIDDPLKCPPCTVQPSCANPCEKCELCIGKTTLPPECAGTTGGTDGSTGQTCSQGQVCNATTPCTDGTYCVTGCCIAIVR
jgi:hypothetical protein